MGSEQALGWWKSICTESNSILTGDPFWIPSRLSVKLNYADGAEDITLYIRFS